MPQVLPKLEASQTREGQEQELLLLPRQEGCRLGLAFKSWSGWGLLLVAFGVGCLHFLSPFETRGLLWDCCRWHLFRG